MSMKILGIYMYGTKHKTIIIITKHTTHTETQTIHQNSIYRTENPKSNLVSWQSKKFSSPQRTVLLPTTVWYFFPLINLEQVFVVCGVRFRQCARNKDILILHRVFLFIRFNSLLTVFRLVNVEASETTDEMSIQPAKWSCSYNFSHNKQNRNASFVNTMVNPEWEKKTVDWNFTIAKS